MKPRRNSKERPRFAESFELWELDLYWWEWIELSPRERLRRSWALRSRLRDPEAVHDEKLFPRP